MKRLELELPWPPSLNHYKKAGSLTRTKSGKLYQMRVDTDQTKRFYYEVWMMTKQKQLPSFHNARLRLEISLYAPSHRRCDIDNPLKALIDSMQRAGLYEDDSQIDQLSVIRCQVLPPHGKVIVTITELI